MFLYDDLFFFVNSVKSYLGTDGRSTLSTYAEIPHVTFSVIFFKNENENTCYGTPDFLLWKTNVNKKHGTRWGITDMG
jgi:hypothetical protein